MAGSSLPCSYRGLDAALLFFQRRPWVGARGAELNVHVLLLLWRGLRIRSRLRI